jgi:hypothetical protein
MRKHGMRNSERCSDAVLPALAVATDDEVFFYPMGLNAWIIGYFFVLSRFNSVRPLYNNALESR